MSRFIAFYLLLIGLISCQNKLTHPEQLYQFSFQPAYKMSGDSLEIVLKNPVKSPIRLRMMSSELKYDSLFLGELNMVLDPLGDTVLFYAYPDTIKPKVSYSLMLGDDRRDISPVPIAFPFLPNKKYKVIQGYGGKYSHQSP